MANYTNVITKKGMEVLTKIIKGDGQTLLFTKMQVGDGQKDDNVDAIDLKSLVSVIQDVPIASYEIIGDGTTKVKGIINNEILQKGFFIWEYGVFVCDPETGEDVLYNYTYTDHPDWMPVLDTTLIQLELSTITAIGRAENVEFIINKSDINPSFEDLDELKKELLSKSGGIFIGESFQNSVNKKVLFKELL